MMWRVMMDYLAYRTSDRIGPVEQWCYYVEAETADDARAKVVADRAKRQQVFENAKILYVEPGACDANDPRLIK
jgi:hypothetical protein